MKISLAVALLLQRVNSIDPPTSGKFFYMDFKNMHEKGTFSEHQVDLQVEKKDFKNTFANYELYIEPKLQSIALVSKDCMNCRIKNLYDFDNSLNRVAGTDTKEVTLTDNQYKGKVNMDTFKLSLSKYFRDVTISQKFFEVSEVLKEGAASFSFKNDYTGYMGIAPYHADADNKEQNFLWQLKNAGFIDSMTVSFFVHLTDSYQKMPSSIKFGSYDQSNIKEGESLTMIQTIDKTTWDLKATKYTVSEEDGIHDETRLRLHPGVPYLYVTNEIYEQFMNAMNQKFSQTICFRGDNVCKFEFRCTDVAAQIAEMKQTKAFDFTFTVLDGDNKEFSYNVKSEHMLISGTHFGGTDDQCVIPVFAHNLQHGRDKNTVFIGNTFMQEYYVVFDMSPLDTEGNDYIQIGIAKQNTDNVGIQKQYNKFYKSYSPVSEELDSSTVRQGHCNQYEKTCLPDPKVTETELSEALKKMMDDAKTAYKAQKSKDPFVKECLLGADKFKDHDDYENLKEQFEEMCSNAYDNVKQQEEKNAADAKAKLDEFMEILKQEALTLISNLNDLISPSVQIFTSLTLQKYNGNKKYNYNIIEITQYAQAAWTNAMKFLDEEAAGDMQDALNFLHSDAEKRGRANYIATKKQEFKDLSDVKRINRFGAAYDAALLIASGEGKDEMAVAALEIEKKRLFDAARIDLRNDVVKQTFYTEQYGIAFNQNVKDHNQILIDEAWEHATRFNQAVLDAGQVIDTGSMQKQEFIENQKWKALHDKTDSRNPIQTESDAKAAWDEYLLNKQQQFDKEAEKIRVTNEANARLLTAARLAIHNKGQSLSQFVTEQIEYWPEQSITKSQMSVLAETAYMTAQDQFKIEEAIRQEKAQTNAIFNKAYIAVRQDINQDDFVELQFGNWKAMPALQGMNLDQETSLRETAIYAYVKARLEWNQKSEDDREEEKRIHQEKDEADKRAREAQERKENEEAGASGVVVFFVLLILFGALGGMGYMGYKYKKDKKSEGAYDSNTGETINADGLISSDLNVQKSGSRVLPFAPAHDVEAKPQENLITPPTPPPDNSNQQYQPVDKTGALYSQSVNSDYQPPY